MSELYVVRHGQASLCADDYDQLSALGELQAAALGAHWARLGRGPSEVVTGPAKRQRETARIAAEAAASAGAPPWPRPVVVEAFDEHDSARMIKAALPKLAQHDPVAAALVGAMSTALEHELRAQAFQRLFEYVMKRWLRGEFDDELWESHAEFERRVCAALHALVTVAGRGRRIALFTSAGPIAVMLGRSLGTSAEVGFRSGWLTRNASVTTLRFAAERELTLEAFNVVEHLPDPATWTHR